MSRCASCGDDCRCDGRPLREGWLCPVCHHLNIGEGFFSMRGYCQYGTCREQRAHSVLRGENPRPEIELALVTGPTVEA